MSNRYQLPAWIHAALDRFDDELAAGVTNEEVAHRRAADDTASANIALELYAEYLAAGSSPQDARAHAVAATPDVESVFPDEDGLVINSFPGTWERCLARRAKHHLRVAGGDMERARRLARWNVEDALARTNDDDGWERA
ncbi:hypothetical protein [Amycolatopsis sp. FDAARGOS 1241]|uniref:hypothetical protein n=1 Tax=Amycolatopsis sp. FDAARGOS 1241 TaxID=2778070 RepID=UPI00194DD6E4|nr:hypothetical protein [Amycolatopsis sp. FDAARGOS 1241]QRP46041.1 hypothetical protein I6J71_44510 [Amycolatopsis sp. FDAARGOS 1241]